jgi:hypothetical protein
MTGHGDGAFTSDGFLWEPLFAIADRVGGDWPERARRAAVALSGEHVKEDDEIGTVLLGDIRDVFECPGYDIYETKEGDKHVKSEKLVAKLVAREDRPWAEFGRAGKHITANGLARLLRGYKVKPGTIRFEPRDKDTAKGYKHSQFVDAFERYLPAPANRAVTPSQSSKIKEFGSSRTITPPANVTAKNAENASAINACDGVTALASAPWETEL